MQTLAVNSIRDCIYSPTGNMEVMRLKGYDTMALVTVIISDLNLAFSFDNVMGIPQVENCVKTLIEKYWTYSPEDFKRCAENIKQLKYIKNFYNCIDEGKVYQCFEMYDKEREAEIKLEKGVESIAQEAEIQNKIVSTLAQAPPEVLKSLTDIATRLLQKKTVIFKNTVEGEDENGKFAVPKKREPTEAEALFQQLLKDFNKLFDQQFRGKTLPPVAFITYNKTQMGVDMYVNTRFNEIQEEKLLLKIREVMPNVTPTREFKTDGRIFLCTGIGWDGKEDCIWYHEVNKSGKQIGEEKPRATRIVKQMIREGKITF